MSVNMMLMSTGVISIAILISMSIPNLLNSATGATSHLPSLFSTLRSWLRPPYLYFIINAIILAIAAISRLHHHNHHNNHPAPPPPTKSSPHHHHEEFLPPYDVVDNVVGGGYTHYNNNDDVVVVKDVDNRSLFVEREIKVVNDDSLVMKHVIRDNNHDDELLSNMVVERFTWNPPPSSTPLIRHTALKKASPEFSSERPPAMSRFGHHRRPAKPALAEGGKALKVSKPKKHETLECTWKAITEGRHIPLTRHIKKSDTWDSHDRQIDLLDDSFPLPVMVKKSETFKEQTNSMSPPVSLATTNKLKKEPSLGQDELNRRVEAFINKFNEDMRLQRQQSMQQFMEMINRAA